jgi:broad specificity phosphatase PhoE
LKTIFVRHGEISSNVNKVYTGWSDEELTPKGVQQAEEAGKRLSEIDIDVVYCSPLKRTRQTAKIICRHLDRVPILNEDFIELRMGPWEGLSEETIANTYAEEWKTWNTFPAELSIPGRETLDELQQRILGGIASIRKDCDERQSVLIVTHVSIIRVMLLFSQSRNLNEYKTLHVENGGIFPFESSDLDRIL